MKAVPIRGWRTAPSGERLAMVICPGCGSQHWLPPDQVGYCNRRPVRFRLVEPNRPKPGHRRKRHHDAPEQQGHPDPRHEFRNLKTARRLTRGSSRGR
jgi:hypothetical protein